eukprot:SAG22_NODE_154_length_17189_cov_38.210064_10_plen_47_part_00
MADGRRGFGDADQAIEVFENLVGDAIRAVSARASSGSGAAPTHSYN